MKHMTAREVSLCGLFVALVAIGAVIRIPVGADSYTLQFLFTLLAGLILGARLGAAAIAVYILLGLFGAPVFAGGGGPHYVFQPTFGYLIGFVCQAFFCGWASRRSKNISLKNLMAINLGGMAIVYAFGLTYFYFISNFVIDATVSLWWVVLYCGILQVVPDALLCFAAACTAFRCKKAGLWLAA